MATKKNEEIFDKLVVYCKDEILIAGYPKLEALIRNYISSNPVLATKNIGGRLLFTDYDISAVYEIFGVDPIVIKKIIKESYFIQPNWEITNNPFNMLLGFLILYYYKHRDKWPKRELSNQPYRVTNLLLTLKFYSTLQLRQFKYEPDPEIVAYTIENLSKKYMLSKMNNIFELIYYTSESNLDNWIKVNRMHETSDPFLDAYVKKLNTRLSSFLKKISSAFYKNHELNKRERNESLEIEGNDGKKNLQVADSISNSISISVRKVMLNLNQDAYIDPQILKAITYRTTIDPKTGKKETKKIVEISVDELSKLLNEMRKSLKDGSIESLINNIISYYIVMENKKAEDLSSSAFVDNMTTVYRRTNTTCQYILDIKETLDLLLKKHADNYVKTHGVSRVSSLKSTVYKYYVLYIATHV